MDILEIISQSLKALSLNKMRTGLATLGIVIGIGSVIALISFLSGVPSVVPHVCGRCAQSETTTCLRLRQQSPQALPDARCES